MQRKAWLIGLIAAAFMTTTPVLAAETVPYIELTPVYPPVQEVRPNPMVIIDRYKLDTDVFAFERDIFSQEIYEAYQTFLEEKAKETEPEIDQHDLELLAIAIYKEAGGDSCCDECRRRVADVILNRVNSDWYPDTIEEVLTQYRQYNTFYWTGVVWPERANEPGEQEAVERAYRIAEEVLRGNHSDLYGDTYYGQAEFRQGKSQIECCGIYFSKF